MTFKYNQVFVEDAATIAGPYEAKGPLKKYFDQTFDNLYHVATYGKVAELAGDAKMARAVGNALHKNPDPEHIPCFRVVNSKGELAGAFAFGGESMQAKLLEADGVEVIDGKVDLKKYGI